MIENINKISEYKNNKIITNSIICENDLLREDNLIENNGLQNKQLQIQKLNIKILDLFKKSNIVSDETSILSGKFKYDGDEELKAMQALQKIKRNLKYAKNNVNENVINKLVSTGLSLNKISFKILNYVMKEVKDIPIDNSLPQTTSNVNNLNLMVTKFQNINNFDDSSILSLLHDEKDISIDNLNIYKSVSKTKTENNEVINLLKAEIEKTMNNNDIELNQENKEISELLVKNDIALSKENLLKVKFLRNINHLSKNDLLKIGTKAIKSDISPTSIDIFCEVSKESKKDELLNIYKDCLEVLPNITNINIYSLLQNQKQLTLLNFKNLKENDRFIENKFDVSVVDAKKQLQQLQQKLTYETIYRLAEKNINISTIQIDKAIDATNEEIKENYKINLRLMEAPIHSKNTNAMYNIFNALSEFKNISSNIYVNIMNNKIPFTIDKVSNSILKEKALEDYESLATSISKKHGDKFEKVEKDIPIFLESIGVKPTRANIKAFTILSKNNIDVSKENLIKTNSIDQKLEQILDNLSPNIAAKMLSDGLDPLKMNIGDVIEYINKFDNEMGNELPEKISSYIMKMDNTNAPKKDRDSMIAIYRLLNNIKKNEDIVIGASLKNGTDLTLGNLLELSKHVSTNKQINHTDITIDDEIKIKINKNNLNSIFKNITPFVLEKLNTEEKDYIDISMEILKEKIETIIQNNKQDDIYDTTNLQDNLKIINNAINSDPETFLWMKKNNIPVTFKNIIQCQKILKENNFLSNQLSEIEDFEHFILDSVEDSNLTSFKNDNDVFSDLKDSLHKYKNNTSNSLMLEKILSVENLLDIQDKINKKNKNIEITVPLKLHDKISNLNMYVMNENLNSEVDELDILISLDTTNLKKVKVLVNIDKNNVSLDFKCENQKAIDFLETNKKELTNLLSEVGFLLHSYKIG